MRIIEIRVGNFVHPCSPPNPVIVPQTTIISRVFQIKFEGIDLSNDITKSIAEQETFLYPYNRVSPIPLTEKWLSKFGFTFRGGLDLEFPNGLLSYDIKEKKMYLMVGQFAECTDTVPCEYVHQLQNLYFALTGEELKASL